MKQQFTILAGPNQGQVKLLDKSLMLLGRSSDTDFKIDDPKVSRRHLELRLEGQGVMVKNLSEKGSLLNGKPVSGSVSLNSGDVVTIGDTKLRYDEVDDTPPPAPPEPEPAAADSEILKDVGESGGEAEDGTRLLEEPLEKLAEEDAADKTNVMVDDKTRILSEKDLPKWAGQVEKELAEKSSGGKWIWILFLLCMAGVGGGYYYLHHQPDQNGDGKREFKDPSGEFSVEFPSGWSKTAQTGEMTGFGYGSDGSKEWVRLNIYMDQDVNHSLTALSGGFKQYRGDNLKQQFKSVELVGSKTLEVNDATAIFFGFKTSKEQGRGIYLLDADRRIVLECFCSQNIFDKYEPVFRDVLHSFRLQTGKAQQMIDFPEPDDGMTRLALSSPEELSRQVDDHIKQGASLVYSAGIRPDNLYRACQEYKTALQLACAAPTRLPSYKEAAEGLVEATKQFNSSLQRQRFEITKARKELDGRAAYWAAVKMMQMVPDKENPAYQEAYRISRSIPKPEGKP